jgi:cytochrome c oxidase subunit II
MMLTKKLVVLGLITGFAIYATAARPRAGESAQVIKITASKFHFTPDHITLVKGQPVTLELTSADRVHGFLIRTLKIDTDVKPGKVTAITVTPQTAGTFTAICDHYCGLGHGNMKMKVVVEEASANTGAAKALSASNTVSK